MDQTKGFKDRGRNVWASEVGDLERDQEQPQPQTKDLNRISLFCLPARHFQWNQTYVEDQLI